MPTAHEVFQQHQFQKHEPLLRGVTGTYLFEIEDVGYWFLSVRQGEITIEEVRHDADCTISCDERDITLAQKFHGLVSKMIEGKKQEAA